jgi:hypothetical protein
MKKRGRVRMKQQATVLALLALLLPATTAHAQQRPLVTQDPETIGSGRILVEGGLDYGRDILFPVSGLRGNLLRAPLLGVMVGISSIAEVEVTGGLHNRLAITAREPAPLASMVQVTGDTTSDVEDVVFATKIRVVSETGSRPAIGVRFATRLPDANNESGLGTDTIDAYLSALVAKTVRSARFVGNLGLGIFGDPTRGDRQNDVVTYGFSLARAMTNEIELVGEINGRVNVWTEPLPGSENRSVFRFGARYTRGPARVDAAALLGMTARDPSIGFAVGVTYIFNAFKVP